MYTYIEPTNITTDRDPTTIQYAVGVNSGTPLFSDTDFDFIVSPLTYFKPDHGIGWVNIKTPYSHILRIDSLFGAIAGTRVIDVDLEWVEHSREAGFIQLVPMTALDAFSGLGVMYLTAFNGNCELPNFWRFNMLVGLKEATGDIQELVGKKAAIRALTAAGLALRPGIGSTSISRDGVSSSVSYISSQKYGIYTGAINHEEWMKTHAKEIRARVRGLIWHIL